MRKEKQQRSPLYIEMGQRIRKRRMEFGFTREQLAERLDISSRFLADIEGGFAGPSLETMKKICTVLGVTSDHLLGMGGTQPDEKQALHNYIDSLSPATLRYAKTILDTAEAVLTDIRNRDISGRESGENE